MKKTTLSLIAVMALGTNLMAGGDIAPVEPVVDPVVETSNWDFNGQAVAYYQTSDAFGYSDIGSGKSTAGNLGLQLSTKGDLGYGFGAGAELTSVFRSTDFSDLTMIDADGQGDSTSAAVTKAYLTYGFGKTSVKVGRQELPKNLSPFAFSEKWNMYSNTFEAATIVNSDIENTTIVGAFVKGANNYNDLGEFSDISDDGVWMLTAQNKSIENLVLTGTYYFADEIVSTMDANILWGDAKYVASGYNFGIQGGYIFGDAVDNVETGAFGAKAGTAINGVNLDVAYSYVDNGLLGVNNLGTGIKTPLYTQMISNQFNIASDADTFKVGADVNSWGANFKVGYGYTSDNSDASADYQELDLIYTRKVGSVDLLAAYVYSDLDVADTDGNNMVRVWGKYNF